MLVKTSLNYILIFGKFGIPAMGITGAALATLFSGNVTNLVGVLRAGGDTRMVAILDILPVWLGAVATTALLALVLDAPIPLICLAAKSEAIFQTPFVIWRLRSRKWIIDIATKKV